MTASRALRRRTATHLIVGVSLLGLTLLLAGGAHTAAAQNAVQVLPEAETMLELKVDRGRLIRLPAPAEAVFLAEPGIADLQVKSATLIYVFGEKVGETTLFAVGANDVVLAGIGIRVTHDLERVRGLLVRSGLAEGVSVDLAGDGVLVSGTVSSPARAQQVLSLIESQIDGDDLINRLKIAAAHQVNLRVRVAEVSRDVLKQFGFNWEALFNNGSFLLGLATGRPFLTAAGAFATRPTSGNVNANSVFGNFSSGNLDLNFMVDALDDEGLISVLAEPNLTARSGQKAEFLAGGEFPILVPQSDDTITIEYKEFGVKLEFTPVILDDGRISIDVAPEVSQLVSNNSVTLNNFVVPALAKRSAETMVELGSGQSFAIAGLIQNTLDHDVQKFPGLGDVPILGTLFRSDTFQRGETELVIIITPYLVRPVSEPASVASPLDEYQPASDLDRLLFGRKYASRIAEDSRPGRPGTFATDQANQPPQRLQGPAGFVLE